MPRSFVLFFLFLLGILPPVTVIGSDSSAAQIQKFANTWLETLTEAQRTKAVMEWAAFERTNLASSVLFSDHGLALSEMSLAQQTAGLRLLRASLSQSGYDKATKIMQLEATLPLGGSQGNTEKHKSEQYFATIYGAPSGTSEWAFTFAGKNLSLSFRCRGDAIIESSPQYFCANPAKLNSPASGPLPPGTRVLRREEELAVELFNKLSQGQQQKATIAAEPPQQLRFVNQNQKLPTDAEGLVMSDMDRESQARLMELIEIYTGAVAGPIAEDRMRQVNSDTPAAIHFACAGQLKPDAGSYYCIRGKSFLIECVNVSQEANGDRTSETHSLFLSLK